MRRRNHDRRYIRRDGGNTPVVNPADDHPQSDHQQEDTTSPDRSSAAASPSTSQPSQDLDHPTKPRRIRRRRGGAKSTLPSAEKSEVNSTGTDAADCLADELSALDLKQNSNPFNNDNSIGNTEEKLGEGESAETEETVDAAGDETKEDIMLTILNDLRSTVIEPDLTDEQLMLNDQLQEDEVTTHSQKCYLVKVLFVIIHIVKLCFVLA